MQLTGVVKVLGLKHSDLLTLVVFVFFSLIRSITKRVSGECDSRCHCDYHRLSS